MTTKIVGYNWHDAENPLDLGGRYANVKLDGSTPSAGGERRTAEWTLKS